MAKEIAVFGGGCFWCTEAVFKMLKGVNSVTPGYTGGNVKFPTYEQVSSGATGHAEVVKIEYEADQISYKELLTVFFATHDGSQLNRQGNDVGTQYRSVVFYTTEKQKEEVEGMIREINASSSEGNKLVTEAKPFEAFYEAEAYHLDYYAKNKEQGYCELVINPKLEKVQKQFEELLKSNT